jgi:hypothetical protein
MTCAKKSKNTDDLIRKVFNAGCVATLYNVYNIETRAVGKMSIDDAYSFFEMKVKLHTTPLAIFYWNATYNNDVCSSFAIDPIACEKTGCPVHGRCIVCRDYRHVALEMHNGLVVSRCVVVKRINDELQMLRESWRVDDALLWRFFYDLSKETKK